MGCRTSFFGVAEPIFWLVEPLLFEWYQESMPVNIRGAYAFAKFVGYVEKDSTLANRNMSARCSGQSPKVP